MVMLVYEVLCVLVGFFFKQKTAYEMRISDWSSDVCSSDLATHLADVAHLDDVPARPRGGDELRHPFDRARGRQHAATVDAVIEQIRIGREPERVLKHHVAARAHADRKSVV